MVYKNPEDAKKYVREWRKNNKDKVKKIHNRYMEKHRDEINAKRRERRVENKDEINAHDRKQYAKNVEKFRKKSSKWAKDNPEKIKKYYYENKEKHKEIILTYRRSVDGWILRTYRTMKYHAQLLNYDLPNFSLKKFKEWVLIENKEIFFKLRDNWIKSGYKTYLSVSVNRLDDYVSYRFSNMEIITWRENLLKGVKGKKSILRLQKIIENNKKEVIQIDSNDNIINIFSSLREASENLCLSKSGISRVCCGKKFNYFGFRGYYSEIKNLSVKKEVIQKTLDNEIIKKYESIRECLRQNLMFVRTGISQACKYKRKYKGFLWEFGE